MVREVRIPSIPIYHVIMYTSVVLPSFKSLLSETQGNDTDLDSSTAKIATAMRHVNITGGNLVVAADFLVPAATFSLVLLGPATVVKVSPLSPDDTSTACKHLKGTNGGVPAG